MKSDKDTPPMIKFALASMGNHWQTKGLQKLDEFKQIATASNIPMNFNNARTNIANQLEASGYDQSSDEFSKELGYRLFEGLFEQPDPTLYACNYGVAIGTTKFLLKTEADTHLIFERAETIRQLVDQIRNQFTTINLKSPDQIVRDETGKINLGPEFVSSSYLSQVIDIANSASKNTADARAVLAQAQNTAGLTVGMLLTDEERLKQRDDLSLKDGLAYIKKQKQLLEGTFFGFAQAMETRILIEDYFKDPQKTARIHLLG